MENADSSEEPEKKRPHLNTLSSPMARNSSVSPDNRSVSLLLLSLSLSLSLSFPFPALCFLRKLWTREQWKILILILIKKKSESL